nr:MAG TPA: cytochrome c-552 [Caudoviricetes sp.]
MVSFVYIIAKDLTLFNSLAKIFSCGQCHNRKGLND